MWQKALFILLIIFILTPYGSPPIALALGLAFALTIENQFPNLSGRATRILLQTSVVLLGFGMNFRTVYEAGKDGIVFTIVTIFGTLLLGYLVGKWLGVNGKTSALISSGTAICGGSAIAAVAPAINAEPEEISVSLGTVFVLNAVALLVFPMVGRMLEMTQIEFGIWSAIAIHDTSSVVGAAATYGSEALAIATPLKLARALWIVPVALFFSFIHRPEGGAKGKIALPWVVAFFMMAVLIRSFAPNWVLPSIFDALVNLAKAGMTVTLFLIGASLSRAMLRRVGARPLLQGVILWIAISIVSLAAVKSLI
jgi:uncharacterized integral membrane protein (TIGR00698 family)